MIEVNPYELCPCGSTKKHKFCCKPKLDSAIALVHRNKDWEAEAFFGVPELTAFAQNAPNPERRKEWQELLDIRLNFGLITKIQTSL